MKSFFLFSFLLVGIHVASIEGHCEDLVMKSRPIERPLLWRLNKDGRSSYLFGTMHIGIRAEDLPEIFWQAFSQTQTYVMELDVGESVEQSLLKLPDGETLARYLSAPAISELKKSLGESFNLSHSLGLATLGFFGFVGAGIIPLELSQYHLDHDLLIRANQKHNRILFLDRRSDAMAAALTGLNAELLEWTLFHLDREQYRRDLYALIRFYQEGNESALSRLGYQMEIRKRSLENFNSLIVARNRGWIPKILEAHSQGPAFVAVGALHLGNREGVLNLLREAGFEIQRVE